jgi:hypothetical protein
MPTYLRFRSGGGKGCVELNCSSGQIKCMSSLNFLDTLSKKLLAMTESLQKQFDECVRPPPSGGGESGVYLAKIDTPKMVIGVKYEYVLYIQRYGPPENGVFDETILTNLRAELGITAENTL